MKYLLSILLTLVSFHIYAQEDEYFADFCLASGKLERSWFDYRVCELAHDTSGCVYAALVNMTQQYHIMLRVYDEVAFKYRRSTAFDATSRPHYLAVMDETEVMLESDLTLRKMKRMVQAVVSLEREGFPRQYDDLNKVLGRLRFRGYYDGGFFDQTIEGDLIRRQLKALEAYVFRRYFEPVIEKLPTLQNRSQMMDFKQLMENTHCEPCREKAVQALLNFYKRSLHHL